MNYKPIFFWLPLGLILMLTWMGQINTIDATLFLPKSFENQLDDVDALIEGVLIKKTYKRLGPKGEVVTKAYFKILRSVGLMGNEQLNLNEFWVLYQGGVWQGVEHKVFGAPKFSKENTYILLLKKTSKGYWVKDLKMGQYQVTEEDGEKVLKSSLFPNHPSFGKTSLSRAEDIIEEKYGMPLLKSKDVMRQKIAQMKYKALSKKSRSLASLVQDETKEDPSLFKEELQKKMAEASFLDHQSFYDQKEEDSDINFFILLLLFSLLGVLSALIVFRGK